MDKSFVTFCFIIFSFAFLPFLSAFQGREGEADRYQREYRRDTYHRPQVQIYNFGGEPGYGYYPMNPEAPFPDDAEANYIYYKDQQ